VKAPRQLILVAALALVAAGWGAARSASPAQAQGSRWAPIQLLFEGPGRVDWPWIVPDAYGNIHGFWMFAPDDEGAKQRVYYTRLDQPGHVPLDIFTFNGNIRGLIGTTSPGGLMVTWSGTNYGVGSEVPEDTARAWSGPLPLERGFFHTGVATAPDGSIWLAYGEWQGVGVFAKRLDIATGVWDNPLLVANTVNPNANADGMRLAFSEDGTMHVVWSEYQRPDGWPPLGNYYARSVDGGTTWSIPLRLAGQLSNQPNVITGPGETVYVAWVGAAGSGGKFTQQSEDGGVTWGDVAAILPPGRGGSTGAPNLALDSAGRLHAVVANGGCILYGYLDGSAWSELECLTEDMPPDTLKEFPAMAITLGNRIDVLFWVDRRQIYHTWRLLDAEAIAPAPTPTPVTPTPTPLPPTSTPVPTNTPLPDFGPVPDFEAATPVGWVPWITGIAPVTVLVVAALLRIRQRNQRR
jgi:hypothetical protein